MMLFFISLQSCEEKLDVVTETDNNQSVITKLTLSQILGEINNPEIQSKLGEVNEKLIKNNPFGRFVISDTLFTKYEDINIPTTYFVTLNSYSEAEPYFLKMVITIEENETKLCFVKYIPNSPTNTLELIDYNGEIQLLDIDENIIARTFFNNGIPLTSTNNDKTSRMECYDQVSIVEIRCSNGGLHRVGESCGEGLKNDAHWEIRSTTVCNYNYVLPSRIYENTIFPRTGGGGGDSNQTLLNNFVNTLDPTEKDIYYSDPEIQNYLLSNIIQPPVINNNPALQPTNNTTTPPKIIDPKAIQFIEEVIVKIKNDPTVYTSIIPFLIEKNINSTNLNPCAKGVFEKVKNTTNCDISQVLAKLDANGSLYNTIIKSEVAPSQQPAQTVRNSAYNYTIYISTDYTGKTKLFIAASMFHELVHTYFLSIVDDYKSNPNNNQNLYNLNSFPSLFQAYCDKKYPPALGVSQNLHHLEMANYYVDAIARALQEYQTGIPVATGSSPQQIYSDLAWGGLNGTPVFDVNYPVGNPNRQRILNRYTCEQNGTPIAAGTSNEQRPIGKPCN